MIRTMHAALEFLDAHIHTDTVRERGTARIQVLLALVENPEKTLAIIHVGGTAGKASTALLTASILEQTGRTVGIYTKPHLIRVNERILVNRVPIPDERFIAYCAQLEPICAHIRLSNPNLTPSYSEILLTIAFLYFRDTAVDCAVIEVGIGGAKDATNVITPKVSVITNIGRAHTNVLGGTLADITNEKMGIIKHGVPCITAVSQPSLKRLIRRHCESVDAPLSVYGKEFTMTTIRDIRTDRAETTGYQTCTYRSGTSTIPDIFLPLRGKHQARNAALAITAARVFTPVSDANVRQALSTVAFPGRLDVIAVRGKTLIMDGAHNPTKVRAFAAAIRHLFPAKRFPVYLPLKHNDDMPRMLPILKGFCSRCVFVRFDTMTTKDRDMETHLSQRMKKALPAIGFDIVDSNDVVGQFNKQKEPMMAVIGSLSLIGMIREHLAIPWSLKKTSL